MSSASQRAYTKIRTMILSGELAAGEQLGEESLAEHCGVSRTPVRDALRRLEAEFLVHRNKTQRSFVADWSIEDIADSFDLRAMLEGRAARRAAVRLDQDAVRRLQDANRAIGKAIGGEKPDLQAFIEANRQFHGEVLSAAASPRLSSLLAILVEQPIVRRTAMQYGAEALEKSHREHEELIAAFTRGDGAWAEAVMTAHVRRAFHAYLDARELTARKG